ncbi:MAG: cytochrome c oxidase subunit I [Candidatus Eremiobacteraeota bacterium]|nr:cytochrome c oxidase subunit I [Candidatus Eremiobacteraeota bacterium]
MNGTVAEAVRPPRKAQSADFVAWLVTTDHKRIGVLYMCTSFAFFLIAGILALAIRAQLAAPGLSVVGPHAFNELFTLHGTAMIFLFVAPFGLGLANYLVPLQVGAADMAFPRVNALSYWLFVAGGLTVFSGAATNGGAADAGWFAYAPLSDIRNGSGAGMDLWIVGLLMVSAASIMTGINLLATSLLYRAPGMTMWRLPVFTWEMIVTSILILMAFPPLATALAMVFVDRRLGGHFFDAAHGGNPILYQHLFWFFGHPEVYIMILPFFGVVSETIPVFSRKPVFGYVGLVLSALAIGGLSVGVWAHHMFATGAVTNSFFSAVSFLIAVPTGVKIFNWIGTMWRGQLTFPTPMLFSIGFLLNFLIGGITGVIMASPPVDFHIEDTYFIVAHLHYVLMGGSVFAIFAAIYFWFPKVFGFRLGETLGKWSFWMMLPGFNLTFFPMHVLGLWGMPRRVVTYPALAGWAHLNLLATAGSVLLALGVLLTVVNVWLSSRRPTPAGDDPWGGYSLEWVTTSPPPEHNYEWIPAIRSERPAYDMRQTAAKAP